MSRFARRTDANQAPIVKALRQLGAYVVDLSRVGGGVPDLLIGWRGAWLLAEVKTEKGKLRKAQEDFRAVCAERGLPCLVMRSVEDVLLFTGGTKS